jgi:uncharacterized membrane protein YfcA
MQWSQPNRTLLPTLCQQRLNDSLRRWKAALSSQSGLSFRGTCVLIADLQHRGFAETQILNFVFVLAVGLVAGTISGIVGTGSSIMLVPVLVYEFGPKEAVPIMAVASVMANLSRILAWCREVDWRACAAYSVTGIPAAALGARTLLVLPSRAVDIAIGVFLIAMVPVRHWLARHDIKLSLWHLALGGAIIGYLTGIVVSTGPLSVPLFLFYGLAKGAFLATEAASSLGLYLSKSVTFQRFGALTLEIALKGLIAGSSLMIGAFVAKRFVLGLDPNLFRLVMDGIMLVAGLSMLWNAANSS